MASSAPGDIAAAAQLACLLEAAAPKPGNVCPGRSFRDLRHEDFLCAAAAIGAPFAEAGDRPVGEIVRRAIEATRRWTRSNANLGIVLLLAPLARAAIVDPAAALRSGARRVLDETTVEDARDVYRAIRMASPGGLGRVENQDVAREPDVRLIDAMRLAAGRDGIAREYATAYAVTFEAGAPAIARARRDGLEWNDAIVEAFLTLLAATPDTHIARRGGAVRAREASALAGDAMAAGGVRSDQGRAAIERMDRRLRDPKNTANPGTTADIIAAALFVVLLDENRR